MTVQKRQLYLIPAPLGESPVGQVIPAGNLEIIQHLDHFVVEEEKTTRRFLIRCGFKSKLESIRFYILNEHTDEQDIPAIFADAGEADLGLISEGGLPAVADPGAKLVEAAYRLKFRVVPLAGPSSLMLALMASGLNGQSFAFNGYLPVKFAERTTRIRFYEKRSENERQTQLFIEAPYRNNQLLEAFLKSCRDSTRLCVAVNLTLSGEWISMKTVAEWRGQPAPDLNRRPAVFVMLA